MNRLIGKIKELKFGMTSLVTQGKRVLAARLAQWTSQAASLVKRGMNRSIEAYSRLKKYIRDSASKGYPYYRHPLPVRIMHWTNVVLLATLLMSGLNIFNSHPALYWGKSSYSGALPVLEIGSKANEEGEISGVTRIAGRDFDTTGFLGASRNADGDLTDRAFPSWLILPGWRWLAMARRWHFFAAWLLVANGLAYVAYSIAGGHLRRDLLPTRADWRSIGGTVIDHLRFRHPSGEASKHYNVLQKCAYLGVIFILLPFMILMGLGMSPALDSLFTGWVDVFSGRQSIRTIHFIIACMLVLFAAVHVFMVIVSGFWNNLRSMITGYYRIKPEADHG